MGPDIEQLILKAEDSRRHYTVVPPLERNSNSVTDSGLPLKPIFREKIFWQKVNSRADQKTPVPFHSIFQSFGNQFSLCCRMKKKPKTFTYYFVKTELFLQLYHLWLQFLLCPTETITFLFTNHLQQRLDCQYPTSQTNINQLAIMSLPYAFSTNNIFSTSNIFLVPNGLFNKSFQINNPFIHSFCFELGNP